MYSRGGKTAPSTPHGKTKLAHRYTSSTSSEVSASGSDYYASYSPASSVSRVELVVSRINSISSASETDDLFSPAGMRTSTNSRISTGRTPTAARIDGDTVRPFSRPGHKATRSMGCFPDSPKEAPSPITGLRKPDLPVNAAHWTPSELAQHIAYTLRTGGPEGDGPTLPAPVIEDVISWVLRSRINGANFLRGVDAYRGARPPPFMPVLSALSRRMRRTLRHRRSSDAFSEADALGDSDGSDGVTRVKRLANAFDAISSCSEVSDAEPSLSYLRSQITGEGITGYGRVTPKTEPRVWTRARRDSLASMDSIASGISAASAPLWRMGSRTESEASTSAAAAAAVASWAEQCSIPVYPPESPTASVSKVKEAERTKAASDTEPAFESREASPPPPYVPDDSPAPTGLLFPPSSTTAPATPESESRSASLTPLQASPKLEEEEEAETEGHLLRMVAHKSAGVDPYAVLRRESGRPSVPVAFDDGVAEEVSHWATARMVTERPAVSIALIPPKPDASPSRNVGRDVAALTHRIRELEARLVAVEKSPSPEPEVQIEMLDDDYDETEHTCPTCSRPTTGYSTPRDLFASTSTRLTASTSSRPSSRAPSRMNSSTASRMTASTSLSTAKGDQEREVSPAMTDTPETENRLIKRPVPAHSWLALLGLRDESGGETRYRDLPVYLFLMGVGVGVGFSAVMVKVVMGKPVR